MRFKIITFAALISALFGLAAAQTPSGGLKPSAVNGEVVSVTPALITVTTAQGELGIVVAASTAFKRVPPENPVLSAAVAATIADIAPGDKLVVSGFYSDDKKTLKARSVYLMTKADIAERQQKEAREWVTRGVSGRVATVDQMTKQIGIDVRGLVGTTRVMLTPKDNAKFLRYAPNSVKFSEAKTSSVLEVQVGDMIRAIGDKSADGASFAAEEIVSGAFQTTAGAVKSVDAAKNEVVISDLQTKKDITIELGSAMMMKKFPEEMAQRLVQMQGGGMRPGGPGGQRPQGAAGAPGGAGGGRPGGGRMAGGIDDMLDRFPDIKAADLKPGDMIAVSSSKNHTPDRITAIKLLAGVEPFIRAAQAAQGANGGRNVTQSLDIPGLDGLSIP